MAERLRSQDTVNLHERGGLTADDWREVITLVGEPSSGDDIAIKIVTYAQNVINGKFPNKGFHHRDYLGNGHWRRIGRTRSSTLETSTPRRFLPGDKTILITNPKVRLIKLFAGFELQSDPTANDIVRYYYSTSKGQPRGLVWVAEDHSWHRTTQKYVKTEQTGVSDQYGTPTADIYETILLGRANNEVHGPKILEATLLTLDEVGNPVSKSEEELRELGQRFAFDNFDQFKARYEEAYNSRKRFVSFVPNIFPSKVRDWKRRASDFSARYIGPTGYFERKDSPSLTRGTLAPLEAAELNILQEQLGIDINNFEEVARFHSNVFKAHYGIYPYVLVNKIFDTADNEIGNELETFLNSQRANRHIRNGYIKKEIYYNAPWYRLIKHKPVIYGPNEIVLEGELESDEQLPEITVRPLEKPILQAA